MKTFDIVVVGSSTGGPAALKTMLKSITRPLPIPMVIVQHMPEGFTNALAIQLDRHVASRVVEAEHRMPLQAGTVYIAPGGKHTVVCSRLAGDSIELLDAPPVHSCRPAVDLLFESVVGIHGRRVLAVMLTGMGCDGVAGSRSVAAAGGRVIAQDEATSVVWAMPGGVVADGSASEVVPIHQMGTAISLAVGSSLLL